MKLVKNNTFRALSLDGELPLGRVALSERLRQMKVMVIFKNERQSLSVLRDDDGSELSFTSRLSSAA